MQNTSILSKLTFILLILTIFSVNLFTQELTLDKAKKLVLENNTTLLSAKQKKIISQMNYDKSIYSLFPQTTLQSQYTMYLPIIEIPGAPNPQTGILPITEQKHTTTIGISTNQPIYNGGKLWEAIEILDTMTEIEKYSFQNTVIGITSDVENKFYNVLEAQDLSNISEENLKTSLELLEIANARFEAGVISKIEYLQIKSQVASNEVSLIQSQNFYNISKIDFANLLQLQDMNFNLKRDEAGEKKYSSILEKLNKLDINKIDMLITNLVSITKKKNPILKMSESSIDINKNNIAIAKGSFLPSLNLNFSYDWTKNNYEDEFSDQGTLTAIFSVPITPFMDNYHDFEIAKLNLKESNISHKTTEDGILMGVKSEIYNLVALAKTVYSSQIALDLARETYNQSIERFKVSMLSTTDLLNIEIMLLSSENNYTRSLYDFYRSISNLTKTIGLEKSEILIDLISK